MDAPPQDPTDGAAPGIRLRAETPHDERFLFEVYAGTRQTEMDATGWDAATRGAFLEMQFRAMRQGYARTFPQAQFAIVMCGEQRIGRVVIDRTDREIRLVDLALLPRHCGRGLGASCMRQLMAEAARAHVPLRLRVYRESRAVRFYRRLGFTLLDQDGAYEHLEWTSTG